LLNEVYRCWILWDRRHQYIIFPFLLLIVSAVSGYMVSGLYSTIDPDANIFNARLLHWITVFHSVAVAQNIITTSLMAWRLWKVEKHSAKYRGFILPVLHIRIESAGAVSLH
ncbi:hypothetical protein B0H19DRAFT_955551, partial [Mycena capillaripes]